MQYLQLREDIGEFYSQLLGDFTCTEFRPSPIDFINDAHVLKVLRSQHFVNVSNRRIFFGLKAIAARD